MRGERRVGKGVVRRREEKEGERREEEVFETLKVGILRIQRGKDRKYSERKLFLRRSGHREGEDQVERS